MNTEKSLKVGVLGAGTMGTGIAQVASANGHEVVLFDISPGQLSQSENSLIKILNRQVEKNRMSAGEVTAMLQRITFSSELANCADCGFIVEAIVEDLDAKKQLFRSVEPLVDDNCILASNTSSLSIASISAALNNPVRFLGVHFFNPAPLMKLVEIIPGISTSDEVSKKTRNLIDSWKKVTVIAKDTPGFIVNRVARPFYGEALRLYEEGIADAVTIDWAMKEIGGFKMGPFDLMDLIGHDVNYKVTESVFKEFYFDPRFKPSFAQKRMVEAGRLGKKSGIGFYDYREGAENPEPVTNRDLGDKIFNRILAMLINEAADAVFMNIASAKEVDLAMVHGVNYPKGLLQWADEIGLSYVLDTMSSLQVEYREDRYRPNPLLKRKVRDGELFHG